ncbi:Imm1 family immunity protein [Lentzea albidocapillata]|uniref:Immunity protein Imm1 n=1 Tax=Lentzea albidocapillata TaxID=40571 RepID=A0A1W2CY82_9PSEU|nr:Imm1 family immunity protein [Lentzea albidocapillata]SMC90219.1 Immunity protein Imm1 [Lentzea albidocapillata]
MIVTAILTTQIGRVARGVIECTQLIDQVLDTEHMTWETLLAVGDVEFYSDQSGPYPNHQIRVSVSPKNGVAALSYTDHDDPALSIANSHNQSDRSPAVDLVFNGDTGALFPRSALIPIPRARVALMEWLRTRTRPTCIEWVPYDEY